MVSLGLGLIGDVWLGGWLYFDSWDCLCVYGLVVVFGGFGCMYGFVELYFMLVMIITRCWFVCCWVGGLLVLVLCCLLVGSYVLFAFTLLLCFGY